MHHHEQSLPATLPGPKRPMQLVYILAYRAPDYVRTQSILQALGSHENIELQVARNKNIGITRYVETWRALRRLRKTYKPDAYILGFRGHELFWPVKWLTHGKPLVFDALMSPSVAFQEENKAGWLGRLTAPVFHRLERSILQHADLVLTDTKNHATLYESRFGVPKENILVIPVGAVEVARPLEEKNGTGATNTYFSVLFFGSMLPLHGIDIIVSAAAKLRDLPIRFDFVGGNLKQAQRLIKICTGRSLTRYTHRHWVPLHDLVTHDIPRADLCLGGPFGGTPQALRVITGKTSQCLALGKATVVGHVGEDIGFEDKGNCLIVPQGDADALAAAILWAFLHRDLLQLIGRRGQSLYREQLSIQVIARRLIPALERLCSARDLHL